MNWKIDIANQTGTGIVIDRVLAVSYNGDFDGVAAYRINDFGSVLNLVGEWGGSDGNFIEVETLIRKQ